MNFGTLTFLLSTFIFLSLTTVISLILITKDRERSLLWKIISMITFILTLLVFFGGNVTNESNGARMNKDKTITQFYIFKDDTYTENIKTFGSITINKTKDKQKEKNKNVKIIRSIYKGTSIFISEENLESFEYDNK